MLCGIKHLSVGLEWETAVAQEKAQKTRSLAAVSAGCMLCWAAFAKWKTGYFNRSTWSVLGHRSLPRLGFNTSKHFCEQEEHDGTGCAPAEDANKDGLRRRDRKPNQSYET